MGLGFGCAGVVETGFCEITRETGILGFGVVNFLPVIERFIGILL